MRLPNAESAIVEDAKLIGYVLNRAHPVGGHHARLFDALLGITWGASHTLRTARLDAARDGEATAGKTSAYGQKYEVRFEMTGPRGRYIVLSVWIVPNSDPSPRLVTAYIE